MKCKDETCGKVCIKEELGEDGNKLGCIFTFFINKILIYL